MSNKNAGWIWHFAHFKGRFWDAPMEILCVLDGERVAPNCAINIRESLREERKRGREMA